MLMGAEELQNWVAYCALQNDDYRKKVQNNMHFESQSKLSDAERGQQIMALFGRKKVNGFI